MSARLRLRVDEQDHLAGSLSAPVVLLEYGDYECPFCGKAYEVVQALRRELCDRLCFAFRNFPLSTVHPHALTAAEAAESASAQGRFWPMHDLLYEHQDALELTDLADYATELDLDVDLFVYDLRTHRFRDKVRADVRSGTLSGVHGTPAFFINGDRHDGGYDFDSLWRAIAGSVGAALGA